MTRGGIADDGIGRDILARLHGAARNKDHGNVEAHGCKEHPRGDLVTVGNAHHGVRAMSLHHVLHRVGNQFAGREGIKHPLMTHSDTVINSNRVELFGNAPGLDNRIRNQFAHVAQVNVTWNELGEGVDDSNDRLTKVIVTHTRCAPQGASASHVAAGCGSCRTERPWHEFLLGVRAAYLFLLSNTVDRNWCCTSLGGLGEEKLIRSSRGQRSWCARCRNPLLDWGHARRIQRARWEAGSRRP